MDTETRELERRCQAGDPAALASLERAWLRKGLGWRGEPIVEGWPEPVTDTRHTYTWKKKAFAIDLVHVQGGMIECDHYPVPEGRLPRAETCRWCSGSNLRRVEPFFAGRFPVLWTDWFAFKPGLYECPSPFHPLVGCAPLRNSSGGGTSGGGGDVTVVGGPNASLTLEVARELAEAVGLRLMTAREWEYAVFGGVDRRLCGHCYGKGETWEYAGDDENGNRSEVFGPCPACCSGGRGVWHEATRGPKPVPVRYRYPWGNDLPDATRCVRADAPQSVFGSDGKPAREDGRSWCGLYDLAGNVSHWVDSDSDLGFAIMGGSYRSKDPMQPDAGIAFGGRRPMDHVGFRLAMSIPVAA